MSADPTNRSPRQFQCREYLWDAFEQMSQEYDVSVDYLVNEAMRLYARSRDRGGPYADQPEQPEQRAAPQGYRPPMQQGGMPPMQQGRPGMPPMQQGGMPPMQQGGMPPMQQGGMPPMQQGRPGMPSMAGPQGRPGMPPMQQGGMPPMQQARPGMPSPAMPPMHSPNRVPSMQGGMPPMQQGGMPPMQQGGMPPMQGRPGMPMGPGPSQPPRPMAPPAMAARQGPGPGRTLVALFEGQQYPVTKEEFVIGRGQKTSDLTIRDSNVSRRHAAVVLYNGQHWIVDQQSTNGIEFNGGKVERKVIEDGDLVRICDHEIQFVYR